MMRQIRSVSWAKEVAHIHTCTHLYVIARSQRLRVREESIEFPDNIEEAIMDF